MLEFKGRWTKGRWSPSEEKIQERGFWGKKRGEKKSEKPHKAGQGRVWTRTRGGRTDYWRKTYVKGLLHKKVIEPQGG